MPDPFKSLDASQRSRLSARAPAFHTPMLATSATSPPTRGEWVYEPKLDGVRCVACRDGDRVQLFSRKEILQNNSYPEIVEALEAQGEKQFVLDGEIVAFIGNVSSFRKLQRRMQVADPARARATGVEVYYYAFDILNLRGQDTTRLPLLVRKALLEQAFKFSRSFCFTHHRAGEGAAYLRAACEQGWEGLIAKSAESRYFSGRSGKWLKLKCLRRQEFVIGGWTDPEGRRPLPFGALLVGFYDEAGDFRYAGKVGTGFTDRMRQDLLDRMRLLEQDTRSFADRRGLPRKGVHWTAPRLVGEVAFTEWTDDGRLRHPSFKGLRTDKDPEEVVREDIG